MNYDPIVEDIIENMDDCFLKEHLRHSFHCDQIFHDRLNGCIYNIPNEIEHQTWTLIKNSITDVLGLWQIAFLYYPFKDKYELDDNSGHPLIESYRNKRNYLLFDLLDEIYSGSLKVRSIPKDKIESQVFFESASLEYQVMAKIHVDDLSEAIGSLKIKSIPSKLVKLWRILAAKRMRPALTFMIPPEAPLVSGHYLFPIGLFVDGGIENIKRYIENNQNNPILLNAEYPLEIRKIDTKHRWYRHRLSPKLSHEITDKYWMEIQADIHKGILSYPLIKNPAYLQSPAPLPTTEAPATTPDGLPFPWLMKNPARKQQLPAQMTEAVYRLFRQQYQRNHETLEELFSLLTPESLPNFVTWRNSQSTVSLVELTLVDGRRYSYDSFRTNAAKKFN